MIVENRICSRCVLDTTASDIWFDEKGECKYCNIHNEMEKLHPLIGEKSEELHELVKKIQKSGKGKKYDCVVGVSGGRDSTYTLYKAVEYGLRPLAVHFDNGWNSEISVSNIKKACDKLHVDLFTIVADWEEFKDLQISFLKASVPDADIPSDYAIYSVLYRVAAKEKIKYILNGHSFRTEGTCPISWTYMDGRYVKSVHRKFGKIKKIKSFPMMNFFNLLFYIIIKRIKEVRLLEYINYVKKDVDKKLEKELGWQYYGGHHHENLYTKFFQSFLLPHKFNIDKRKIELSALIRSGQLSREKALEELNTHPYLFEKETVDYAIKKLGLTHIEFDKILNTPVRSFHNYPSYFRIIKMMKYPIMLASKMKILPYILYLKYAK